MERDRRPTTWPCLLPRKKIRCYRRQDPVTGRNKTIQSCPPDQSRISLLPDEIQTLILDLLPTNEAVRTSVLSKKWRYLCYSLHSLSFVQSEIKYEMKDVMDPVLRNYNASSIDTLFISLNDPAPHNHMDEWVAFAVSHQVQTFEFSDTSTSKDLYALPSTIFSCARLKVLKLAYIHINFPTGTVFLPSLILLKLKHCRFTDVVFSTCNYPKLVELAISDCLYDTLSISSSVLRHLHILSSVGNPKVNLLSIPSLSTLCYLGEDPPSISPQTLLSLRIVFFVIKNDHFRRYDLVGKMWKGMPCVRDLRVGAFYIECLRLDWDRRLLDYPVHPCFNKINYLRLVYSGKPHVPVLKVVLRSYPSLVFLETSCLVETTEDDNNADWYWEEKQKERLPANFLNRLVTYDVLYRGVDEESEFELMKFVVENAIALRNINISVGAEVELNAAEDNIRQKLKTFSQKSRSQLKLTISRSPCT